MNEWGFELDPAGRTLSEAVNTGSNGVVFASGNEAGLAVFKRREIKTQIAVASGSTIGLGGLINEKLKALKTKCRFRVASRWSDACSARRGNARSSAT